MKNAEKIVYGYVDESGTAGVSGGKNEFLVVSLVLLSDDADKKVRSVFTELRQKLKLRPDYEFHYSKSKVEMRTKVFDAMRGVNFRFVTFAIKKDGVKSHASFANMADKIIQFVMELGYRTEIVIDENPVLYKELNKMKKKYALKNIRFIQCDSRKKDGLQLADHVVSGHARILKGQDEPNFQKIKSKIIKIEIVEYN